MEKTRDEKIDLIIRSLESLRGTDTEFVAFVGKMETPGNVKCNYACEAAPDLQAGSIAQMILYMPNGWQRILDNPKAKNRFDHGN